MTEESNAVAHELATILERLDRFEEHLSAYQEKVRRALTEAASD